MIVAVTGHRPDKLGGYDVPNPLYTLVRDRLKQTIIQLRPVGLITGMALGADQMAAEVCIELGVPFLAAVPFKGQEKAWPRSSQKTYAQLLAKAARIKIVSAGGYTASKMQIRNRYMVDNCNHLIAVFNGTMGGTFNCIQYAKAIEKPITYVEVPA